MKTHIEEQVEELRATIDNIALEVTTSYTLADAMREGATVSGQAYNWTDSAGNMCSMSAAVVAAKARGYMS